MNDREVPTNLFPCEVYKMKTPFAQTRFTLELTNDQSPTLRLPEDGESMHHSGGAAAETQYIYKSVIEESVQLMNESKTCVVGLGLGYIEISWAMALLQTNLNDLDKYSLVSFETEENLKENFKIWLHTNDTESVYDQICWHLNSSIEIKSIKKILRDNFERFPFEGDFYDESVKHKNFNIVCYDAFSSKTTEKLWSEEFIGEFLKNSCAENCVLTTYACTGVLKRALQAQNFSFYKRAGFHGKRDSSLALRGLFKTSAAVYRIS